MIIYLITGILYIFGIPFTIFVDKTMLNQGVSYTTKHVITLTIVWLLSPFFMVGLLLVTIFFFFGKRKKAIEK